MMGPGKYDALCTLVREQAEAVLVAVIVMGGNHGSGFAVQTVDPSLSARLPGILRDMADEIERTPQGHATNGGNGAH